MSKPTPLEPVLGRVGPYRLLDRIGEGGMGIVYLAESVPGLRVALKVLRPQIVMDAEGRRRFDREINALRQVHSPHIAWIMDADATCETPYVVTRFVPGHSLDETVRRTGPLAEADLVHLGLILLDALKDVHAAGVLHRDLKPTNVVLEGRNPVLIDFGVARSADDVAVTAAGWMVGTMGYVAPEIVFGDQATAATDVHGWAATLTFAALGRSPYGEGAPMAVLDRTRRGAFDLDGVSPRLREILAACLSVEPHQRPTVAEARVLLEALHAGAVPTQVVPAPATAVVPVVSRTMPWQVAAATSVVPLPAAVTRPDWTPAPGGGRVVPLPRPTHGTRNPTRVETVLGPVASVPHTRAYRVVEPTPPGTSHAALSSWSRARRTTVGAALLLLVAVAVSAAPYLTVVAVASAAWLTMAVDGTQGRLSARRERRGDRWFDLPRATLAFPYRLLAALPGAVLLVGLGAVAGAALSTAMVTGGVTLRPALVAGGLVLGSVVWWGPGSLRFRPVWRTTTRIARSPKVTGGVVAGVLAATAGLALSSLTWAPASQSPRHGVQSLIDRLPGR